MPTGGRASPILPLPLARDRDMLHDDMNGKRPHRRTGELADGTIDINAKPTEEIAVREVFGIDTDMIVKGFAERSERVPEFDSTYKFDPDTTLAILAGFSHNRRVTIEGYHGTGNRPISSRSRPGSTGPACGSIS